MNHLIIHENKWGIDIENPHKCNDFGKYITFCHDNLNITSTSSTTEVQSKFDAYIKELITIYNDLKITNSDNFEIIIRINRLLEVTYYAKSCCTGFSRIYDLMDLSNDYRNNSDINLFRFSAIDTEQNKPFQNFLLFLLDYFYENNYARYNNDIYTLIKTKDHLSTFAWKRIDSISNTIYSIIKKETNYEQFLNATNRGDTVKQCVEFLSNCQDSQFHELKKDRRVFSFRNGIYFADTDSFYDYKSVNIPKNTVSSKYFDLDFNTKDESWKDIETPYFDSIFKHQDIPDEILKWIYIFTGRLIYEIDERDGWQVIFFIQGQAGTGKSTYVMNVCKQLYDEEDVGVMSNNIQPKFGLADLVDRLLYVAPEIKRDFSIEQGEFQSIISGDKVTINIKCKSSRFINWSIPGVMAGNESPDFIDNSGSIQRRLMSIKFNKRVHEGDLLLGRKIKNEMSNIIKKCNKVYIEYSDLYGRSNIWSILPDYFHNTRSEIAQSTNSLIHFLSSGSMEFTEDKYIPEKIFVNYFNQHCMDNNYKRQRFNHDFYSGPFSQFNIKIVRDKKRYLGKNTSGTFFVGLDIKTDSIDIESDNEDNNL